MSRPVVQRDVSTERFVSQGNQLIVANVETTAKAIALELQKCFKMDGKLVEEIQKHTELRSVMPDVQKIYRERLQEIYKVKPLDKYKGNFSPEDIRDIHLALISYTVDKGPYTKCNDETVNLITGKLKGKYSYSIYMAHIWCGLTCFYEPGKYLPQYLYRGVRAYAGNLKVGQIFAFPSLISTSGSLQVAKRFAKANGTIIRITSKDSGGLNTLWMEHHTAFPGEDEYLLEPTHIFKVTAIGMLEEHRAIDCIVARTMTL